jgi:hypothetical protein
MDKFIVSLIKFTNYPDDVINGNLYCNRLKYFRDAEQKEIGDKLEAIAVRKKYLIGKEPWKVDFVDDDSLTAPVFSMYAVMVSKPYNKRFLKLKDERLKDFGKKAVVVLDVGNFLKRVRKRQPEFKIELVRYIDYSNLTGIDKLAIFNPIATKDKCHFEHQHELRIHSEKIALSKDIDYVPEYKEVINEDHIKIPIGDLRDIAKVHDTDELFNGIDVNLVFDWENCSTKGFLAKIP